MKHILGANYLQYPVTQKFLEANQMYKSGVHMGTDYATSVGTPIYAPLDGEISQCFNMNPSMGNAIYFKCNGFTLRIMHLSSFMPVGLYKEGDIIAHTGNTGLSTGAHVHVDVTRGDIIYSNLLTRDGIIANMVDYEVWCLDNVDASSDYKVLPIQTPSVSHKIDTGDIKTHLVSMGQTFSAIAIPIVISNLQTFDVNNLSKETLAALGISILRQVIKVVMLKYAA